METETRKKSTGKNDGSVGQIGFSNLEREPTDTEPWHKVGSDT